MTEIIVGFITGITASLGLGGGFVLIIYLTLFKNTDQITAGGINLLFFLPVAILAVIMHSKNKLIKWKIMPHICVSGIVGVAIGTAIGSFIDAELLRKAFAALLIYVGIRELFCKNKQNAIDKSEKG